MNQDEIRRAAAELASEPRLDEPLLYCRRCGRREMLLGEPRRVWPYRCVCLNCAEEISRRKEAAIRVALFAPALVPLTLLLHSMLKETIR